MIINNREEAKKFLQLMINYIVQYYDTSNQYFDYFKKFTKEEFPLNCYYSGTAYRKTEYPNGEFGEFHSCSKEKGANRTISLLHNGKYYQFTCKNAFDIKEIYLYLMNKFSFREDEFEYKGILLTPLIDRLENEKEIITRISRRDFKKEKQ